jgi:hypothetical protein
MGFALFSVLLPLADPGTALLLLFARLADVLAAGTSSDTVRFAKAHGSKEQGEQRLAA